MHEKIITVPPGVEINYGLTEDSDSVVTHSPTQLKIIGPLANGAYPVHIIEDGKERPELLFYHQPEPKPPRPE